MSSHFHKKIIKTNKNKQYRDSKHLHLACYCGGIIGFVFPPEEVSGPVTPLLLTGVTGARAILTVLTGNQIEESVQSVFAYTAGDC